MNTKTTDHELYLLLKYSTKAVSRFNVIPTRILMTCLKVHRQKKKKNSKMLVVPDLKGKQEQSWKDSVF